MSVTHFWFGRSAVKSRSSVLGAACFAHARSLGFRQGMALEVLSLGIGAWHRGDFEEARDWFEEARRLFAEIDNQRGVAQAEMLLVSGKE